MDNTLRVIFNKIPNKIIENMFNENVKEDIIDINGFCVHDFNLIYVNLSSEDFLNRKHSENRLVSKFSYVITHEILHMLIDDACGCRGARADYIIDKILERD